MHHIAEVSDFGGVSLRQQSPWPLWSHAMVSVHNHSFRIPVATKAKFARELWRRSLTPYLQRAASLKLEGHAKNA